MVCSGLWAFFGFTIFMVTVLIMLILGITIQRLQKMEESKYLLFALVVGIIAGGGVLSLYPGSDPERIDYIYIYTIDDYSGIHGSFSLGSGTINSYPAYCFYRMDGNGALYLESINAKNVPIYRDTENNPYLIKYTTDCEVVRYEFHVPKDTVIQHYTLDGQI